MVKMSISRAWDESKAILVRESRLLSTVALALFVLPGAILSLVMPETTGTELPPAGPWIAVALIALLISLVGQLAVIRLALPPVVSVGEAIRHGALRFIPYLGALVLFSLPFLAVGLLIGVGIAADPSKPAPAAAFGVLILAIAFFVLSVRFFLSSAVASAEPGGPLQILRRSWQLSRGNGLRGFVFLLLFVIAGLVLIEATQVIVAIVARLILGGIEPLSIGGLLVAIATQIASALVSVAFFVMLARLYRQLAGAEPAEAGVPSSGT